MILFPAIDIKDGKVVRLMQGNFDQVTEYSFDPLAMAEEWQAQGAKWLHLVDLDGAKTGSMANHEIIIKIANTLKIPIEVGGGIRSQSTVDNLLNNGISRIIVGTKAIEDRPFLKNLLKQYGEKIAVSLDCHNGFVAQRGWVETSTVKALDLVKELKTEGVQTIIYTDISRDGMLSGPNLIALEEIAKEGGIPVIASGGVSCLEDIRQLKKLETFGVCGIITGKAIYEGKLDLKEALKLC